MVTSIKNTDVILEHFYIECISIQKIFLGYPKNHICPENMEIASLDLQ